MSVIQGAKGDAAFQARSLVRIAATSSLYTYSCQGIDEGDVNMKKSYLKGTRANEFIVSTVIKTRRTIRGV